MSEFSRPHSHKLRKQGTLEDIPSEQPLQSGRDEGGPSRRDLLVKGSQDLMPKYGAMNDEQVEMLTSKGVVGRYDYESLASYKVLGVTTGTVLRNVDLWKETLAMALMFWIVFGFVFFHRWDGFSNVIGSEAGIRAFIAMFSTLICLLLSFYTALTLGRWWQMRLAIEQIQDGCKELTMILSQSVSDDEVLLDGIQRYARASLYLIFLVAQHEDSDIQPLQTIHNQGVITSEEYEKMMRICPHSCFVQAETFWVWLGNAVTRAHKQGLTQGAPHYCQLMKAVDSGRSGVTKVKSYLDTPIPIGYVHLLCFIVKLHNIILTIMSALLAVMFSGGDSGVQVVSIFRTSFKAFFMPFLYNSILFLNAECTDPFGGDPGDFNWNIYDVNLTASVKSYANAAQNLPDWVLTTKFEGVKDKKEGV
jgi:hypothetical protein